MPRFQTIIVAADFSESSREAFKVACSLARADKTRLLVLNVVEPLYSAPETVYFGDQTVPLTLVERDQSYYDSVKERLRQVYVTSQPIETEYQTRDGEPAEEILRAALDLGCQLIVMGTHGRSGLDRLLTGSIAEQVIRKSHCPVLALRSHATEPGPHPDDKRADGSSHAEPAEASQAVSSQVEANPVANLPLRLVLHPTDFSETSDAALRVARSLAQEQNAPLLILHVIATESVPIQVPPMPIDRESIRTALQERRTCALDQDPKLIVETVLKEGDPIEEILRVAEQSQCALIVMGTHGRRGLGRLLMGSVTEAILRRSESPVLTVKAGRLEPHSGAGEPYISGAKA